MSDIKPLQNQDYSNNIQVFERSLHQFYIDNNLPVENILVVLPERIKVFQNVGGVLELVKPEERLRSVYLSKFIAAVGGGLFDAALNYLWDETILQIRKRVTMYDIEYFYDNAVTGDKRTNLKDEEDIIFVSDYDLIRGAKAIGLISDIGFKHLEYINYMRNRASAAHPNQNDISGLQLIGWLETCIKEVITLPISDVTVEIKKVLVSIKKGSINDTDATEIAYFTKDLTQEQLNNFAMGLFGIYVRDDTESQTYQNINRLMPKIWSRVDEETRKGFGLKHANYAANNNQASKKLAQQFLELVGGESYITEELRIIVIENALNSLLDAHRGLDNFYNEPSFAIQLQRVVGSQKIPDALQKKYVHGLVEVFLTNGVGVAKRAEPIYIELLSKLDSELANLAVLSFRDSAVASKLQHRLCKEKYQEMLNIMKPIMTSPPVRDLIEDIENYTGDWSNLKLVKSIEAKLKNLEGILP